MKGHSFRSPSRVGSPRPPREPEPRKPVPFDHTTHTRADSASDFPAATGRERSASGAVPNSPSHRARRLVRRCPEFAAVVQIPTPDTRRWP